MADDLNVALVLRLVDKATKPARAAMKRLGDIGKRTQEQQDALRRRAAVEVAGVGAALTGLVTPAIQFESAMADVRKVIDLSPDALERLGQDIQELSQRTPKTVTGIAKIVEAASQADLVDKTLPDDAQRRQLIAFAEDAARIGTAFDLTAQKAADFMTTARNRMALSQQQTLALSDAVNHLSNNMAASAPAVTAVIGRYGAVGQQAGFAHQDVAALSAAFVQNAQSPEVAATAMNAFLRAITKGEAATANEASALKQLGFNAVELSERMQRDAKGAVMDLLAAFQELDKAKRPAVLNKLFEGESVGVISGLVENAKQLPEAFALVGDKTQFAGSALEEYKVRAETTANNLKLARNTAAVMATTLGSELLPALNDILDTLIPIVQSVGDWARQNPELTRQLMVFAGVVFGLRVAMLALPIRGLVVAFRGSLAPSYRWAP